MHGENPSGLNGFSFNLNLIVTEMSGNYTRIGVTAHLNFFLTMTLLEDVMIGLILFLLCLSTLLIFLLPDEYPLPRDE